MEDQLLKPSMWGSILDMLDAYLQIPMFPPHRKYLRFCGRSSLPISSHALRHHSCTKAAYQANGCSSWSSTQSTNSHFSVSGRLTSQKSDSRNVTSSIKTNNATSGRSRIDNQFGQMPFSAFRDNYLSGCSFQPEQRISSPLREQVCGN